MKKILIVEDAAVERELLIEVLRGLGIHNEVMEASSGEEAIEILGRNYKEIGLILLDWQMAEMSGLDFMEGIVKVPSVSSIPIVMVTASGSQDDQMKAKATNPRLAGYIVKPYEPDDLLKTVQAFLN